MSEKEEVVDIHFHEERREALRFRHRVGLMISLTTCVAFLSFVFILGWAVVVQERELHEGVVGDLFQGITEVLKIVFG